MTIQDLGAIGEFIGSGLILVTLVYLAIQTRQSKETAELETARMVVADFNDLWTRLADNRQLATMIRVGINDWERLDNIEKSQVHAFFIAMTLHWVSARRQSSKLLQLQDFMEGWEDNLLSLIATPGGRSWFEFAKHILRPDDLRYLEARLENPDSMPPSWLETFPWNRLDPEERNEGST